MKIRLLYPNIIHDKFISNNMTIFYIIYFSLLILIVTLTLYQQK